MLEIVEPLILSVSGRDRPGILARLTAILAEVGVEVVDIEQATLQDFLALSFLIDLGGEAPRGHALLRSFFPAARELGLAVEIRPISHDELRVLKDHDLWALTLLSSMDTAATVARVAAVIAAHGANVVSIRRLSEANIRAAELMLDASRVEDLDGFRSDLLSQAEQSGADIALAREDAYRRSKRVVVMDADSTLIDGEVIDELARRAGVEDAVRQITHRAMEGELDFAASLRERVKLLRGLPESALPEVAAAMPLTPGAEETVRALKNLGLRVGVISGGFSFFTRHLRDRLGLDFEFANTLELQDGALTGELLGPILDAEGKAERLRDIARGEGVHPSQVVGVGDGANDIPMLRSAGLGVAFCAREATRRAADGAIHRNNLEVLLYLLGVSARDLRRIAQAQG